jgi:GNAT superfamily N-acetyltransferase
MPESHATANRRIWGLPTFDRIAIVYTTEDLYENEHGDGTRDLDMDYAQTITGAVTGVAYPDGGGELTVPLGKIELVRIDVYETGSAHNMYEVLDSRSGDLESLWPIIDQTCFSDESDDLTKYVVIADRLEVVPEARGHGLGLHVLARAIRTWAVQYTLVALIASPTDREDDDDQESLRLGRAKLSRYYQQLGLQPFGIADADKAPRLYAHSDRATFWEKIEAHCRWTPPQSTSES